MLVHIAFGRVGQVLHSVSAWLDFSDRFLSRPVSQVAGVLR
jgi:hypothetical protein